ncbi:hypothetical protein EJ04DRAFT_265169 [Polyplosphaeria fusca]|uniref:Uncharacterized protein n=1 Tax=Polyplosphaeria fusca TaxID=682080 RepID=A0A9P4QZ65_9PLEO|nr:hypothetical protein EJ04DRAFT_265169 [Polyplosphaeria fusca]
MEAHLISRDDQRNWNPSDGSRPADEFNNKGFQALFAIIGMGMCLTALWFFFWAKNGGFKWRQNDWEDYKSTVLRRKGPDGKTLSNATKSTKLGGGSVVHGGSYGAPTVGYTDETSSSAGYSEMREVEEGKGHRTFGLRGGDTKKHKRENYKNDWKDPELRNYRQEKAARVGGLNRQADGVYTDFSMTGSDLGSNISSKPLVEPKDKKKLAKDKERRAKERMRQAKLAEKEAAKTAAAEAKAKKTAEKVHAKEKKAEEKRGKKDKKIKEPEPTPTEAAPTEATPTELDITEAARSEVPRTRRSKPSAAYSFTTGDDTNTVYSGAYTENRTEQRTNPSEYNESSYYSDYRPNAEKARSNRDRRSETRSRHSSPRKQHRSSRAVQDSDTDIFTQTNGDVQGTIQYPCHIPGLSSAGSVGVSESVSQVGGPSQKARRGRDVMDGYRRGGVRTVNRRDSLSDSD